MGAADRALSREPVGGLAEGQALARRARTKAQCASLKSNVGHLEAAAAAAGLSSLILVPIFTGVVAVNAQLRGFVAWESCLPFPVDLDRPTQAERPPVVDRVVDEIFVVRHAGGADGAGLTGRGWLCLPRGPPQLVWLQRDHRPRGVFGASTAAAQCRDDLVLSRLAGRLTAPLRAVADKCPLCSSEGDRPCAGRA